MSINLKQRPGLLQEGIVSKRAEEGHENEETYLYRWGHSLVSIPENDDVGDGGEYLDTLLMIGGVHKAQTIREDGKEQVLVKNMPTLLISGDLTRLEIVAKSGVIPPIFGHSCRYVRGFYLVVCIGGFDTASDIFLARSIYGVFIFDVRHGMWRSAAIENLKFETGGLVPEYGIAEAGMEIVRPANGVAPVIVVVGGRSQCYNCYNSYRDASRQRARGYIRYSARNRGILLMNVLFEPANGVYGHCTVSDGNVIYTLFGSLPLQGPAPTIRKFQIQPNKDRFGYTISALENVLTVPPLPSPRVYPACLLYGKQIFIFGGIEVSQSGSTVSSALQDSWKLDLQTLQWTRLKESSRSGPGPRWRSASAVVALTQEASKEIRNTYNYDTSKEVDVTGMVIHGGLTSAVAKEDQRFYFLRNVASGGWKGVVVSDGGLRSNTIAPQQIVTKAQEPKLNYYIQAIIVLLALIVFISAAYLLRGCIPKRLRMRKSASEKSPNRKIITSITAGDSNSPKTTQPNSTLPLPPFSVKPENIAAPTGSNPCRSLDTIPSILEKSTPSVIAAKQENRSPNRKNPENNLIRSLSSRSIRKSRRASSMSWVQAELKNKYPEIAAIASPKLPKTTIGSSSSSNSVGLIDLLKPYVVVQSFVAQRYDEVSLTRGDLCTLRLVFKDNWAVGMNLTLRKTGIIPVACLQVEDNSNNSGDLANAPYFETEFSDGVSCSVKLDMQKPLKELDQLLESRAVTIDQYLDRRKAIFRSCGSAFVND